MRIRRATVEDAEAIAEVHVRSWQETYVGQIPQAYLDGLSPRDRVSAWRDRLLAAPPPDVLVAVDDSVVAFMIVDRSRDADADDRTGEVPAIYARQQVWGTGLGRRLMDEGLALLADSGHAAVTLWVLDTNERARRFYEAGGWAWDGTTKQLDIGGALVNELRYRRPISPESGAISNHGSARPSPCL